MFPDPTLIKFKLEEKTYIKDKKAQLDQLLALSNNNSIDKFKLLLSAAESLVKAPDSHYHVKVVYNPLKLSEDECLRHIQLYFINIHIGLSTNIDKIQKKYLLIHQEILTENARREEDKRLRKQAILSSAPKAEKNIILHLLDCLNLIKADIIWVYSKSKGGAKRKLVYYLSPLKRQILEDTFLLIAQIYIQNRYKDTFKYYYEWLNTLNPSLRFSEHLYHYVLRLFSILSTETKLNIFRIDQNNPSEEIVSLLSILDNFLAQEAVSTPIHQRLAASNSAIDQINNIKDFSVLSIKNNSHRLNNFDALKNINDFKVLQNITKDFLEKIKLLWDIFKENWGLDFLLDHFYCERIPKFREKGHHTLLKAFIEQEMYISQ